MSDATGSSRPARPGRPGRPGRRRWPLLAIGASAGTAVWSGWVGLGELTGFGVVRPLPGIADGFAINTAVTLPIGVEAYAMYALSIATSNRALPDRTRRYAWASSAAALLLGMAGQVAYHVMTAHQPPDQQTPGSAPWWVIALVSCLPVLVLGAASLLWHLAGDTETPELESGREYEFEPSTGHTTSTEHDQNAGQADHASSTGNPAGPEHEATSHPLTTPRPTPAAGRIRTGTGPAGRVVARRSDVAQVRAAITTGDLPPVPTVQAIRDLLGIGSAYASATRDAITRDSATSSERREPAPPGPDTAAPPALNGHLSTAPCDRAEESEQATTSQPEHLTEALFTDDPTQSFNSNHHDLNHGHK